MSQITHRRAPDTGCMAQIVSAAELRRVLRSAGDSLRRPNDFRPGDEWYVDDADAYEDGMHHLMDVSAVGVAS